MTGRTRRRPYLPVLLGGLATFHLAAGPTTVKSSVENLQNCRSIQQAVDALPPGGGRVEIPAGAFVCDRPLIIDRSDVTVQGRGTATSLRLADGANCPLMIVGDWRTPPSRRRNIRISDLVVDGNRLRQSQECWTGPCDSGGSSHIRNSGIVIRGVEKVVVERVAVSGARSSGLVSERGSVNVTIRDFAASDNQFDGLAAYQTTASSFVRLSLFDNLAAGLSFDQDFDQNTIENVSLVNNGSVGLFMRDSHRNVFRAIRIGGSGEHGVFLAQVDGDATTGAHDNRFEDCRISDSGRSSMDRSRGHAIRIQNESCRGNMFARCYLSGNRGRCISTRAVVDFSEILCKAK